MMRRACRLGSDHHRTTGAALRLADSQQRPLTQQLGCGIIEQYNKPVEMKSRLVGERPHCDMACLSGTFTAAH